MLEGVESWVDTRDAVALYAYHLLDHTGQDGCGCCDCCCDSPEWLLWDRALEEATWVLSTLSGGKIHPSECWSEVYSMRGSCEIILRNGPILAVGSVTVIQHCGAAQELIPDYCQNSAWSISLCCNGNTYGYFPSSNLYGWLPTGYGGHGCGHCDTVVRIDYRTQSTLPPGTVRNVAWLANEYVKSANGKACALPDRITNITRQGVSWSLLDPQDFLDKRLTGTRLDQWLTTVRAAYPPATLIDPLKSARLFSRKIDCNLVAGPGGYGYGAYGDGVYGAGEMPPPESVGGLRIPQVVY